MSYNTIQIESPATSSIKTTALLIVDVQNDFCTGGSLAVPGCEKAIEQINSLRRHHSFDQIILTKDYHPASHVSFAVNHPGKQEFTTIVLDNGVHQELWPVHCVAGSAGSDFHKDLFVQDTDTIIYKGKSEHIDSYSGFGAPGEHTGLLEFLQEKEVQTVYVCGLAYDFCVGSTALDSVKYGFDTVVITDASASISEESVAAMNKKFDEHKDKLTLVTTQQVLTHNYSE